MDESMLNFINDGKEFRLSDVASIIGRDKKTIIKWDLTGAIPKSHRKDQSSSTIGERLWWGHEVKKIHQHKLAMNEKILQTQKKFTDWKHAKDAATKATQNEQPQVENSETSSLWGNKATEQTPKSADPFAEDSPVNLTLLEGGSELNVNNP